MICSFIDSWFYVLRSIHIRFGINGMPFSFIHLHALSFPNISEYVFLASFHIILRKDCTTLNRQSASLWNCSWASRFSISLGGSFCLVLFYLFSAFGHIRQTISAKPLWSQFDSITRQGANGECSLNCHTFIDLQLFHHRNVLLFYFHLFGTHSGRVICRRK